MRSGKTPAILEFHEGEPRFIAKQRVFLLRERNEGIDRRDQPAWPLESRASKAFRNSSMIFGFTSSILPLM